MDQLFSASGLRVYSTSTAKLTDHDWMTLLMVLSLSTLICPIFWLSYVFVALARPWIESHGLGIHVQILKMQKNKKCVQQ